VTPVLRVLMAVALLGLGACSSEPEPVAGDAAAEQAAAREKAKQGAFGAPIEALDKAAAVQDTLDQARAAQAADEAAATDEDASDDDTD
jgi:hypothetical protein